MAKIRVASEFFALVLVLSHCHCTPAGHEQAKDPARAAEGSSPPPLIDSTQRLARLVGRAKTPEREGKEGDWDHAIEVGSAIRARVELLRSGLVGEDEAGIIRGRAFEAAALVLRYEARGDLGEKLGRGQFAGIRGFGTSKPIKVGPISMERAIDAYSTGTTLSGLSDLVEWGVAHHERPAASSLFSKLVPIVDYWDQARTFDVPGGGRAWEKIATSDPAVRRFVIINTDAIFARVHVLLARAAREMGDNARAAAYESVAAAVARRLEQSLVAPVIANAGALRASAWVYGWEIVADGKLVPQRGEDSNHASYTLDFLSTAVERSLGGSGAPFTQREVSLLGQLLGEAVIVKRPDGNPAYTVFIDPGEVERTGARGRKKLSAFSFTPDGERTSEVASWWKELSGATRTLDLGLSIRTSWGWSEAVRNDRAMLAEVGRSLDAEARIRGKEATGSSFLSEAVWLRMSASPESP